MRKGELWLNLISLYGPIIVGLLIAMMIPAVMQQQKSFAFVSVFFYVFGFVLFAISKWSVIKTGRYFTFGSLQMSKGIRILYRIGYLLMVLGLLSTLSLFIVLK